MPRPCSDLWSQNLPGDSDVQPTVRSVNYRKKGGDDGEGGNRVREGWHEGGGRDACSGGCEAVERGWMQGGCEAADGGSRRPPHTQVLGREPPCRQPTPCPAPILRGPAAWVRGRHSANTSCFHLRLSIEPAAIPSTVCRAYLLEWCCISNKEPWPLRDSSGLVGGQEVSWSGCIAC